MLSRLKGGYTLSEGQNTEQRQLRIVEMVSKQGFLTIETLAKNFGLTVQTIRRDVNALAAEGRLSRYRGGAGLASSIENMEYQRRQVVNLAAKQAIANNIAADVPDHAALFINIGTTTEQVARALLGHRGLTVITNNLHVAGILSENASFSIVMTGGRLRNRDGAVTGQPTLALLEQYRVDIGIIGISGIDQDGGLFDFDADEVLCTQAIMRNSRRVFLVTDHSKFGRSSLVKVGNISQISALYTDAPPPGPICCTMREHGIRLNISG
jgi:DeoR family glycerol-3-phosphate regulon repressor